MSDFADSSVTASSDSGQASDTPAAATSAAESTQSTATSQSQPVTGDQPITGQQSTEGAATAPPPEAEKPVYEQIDPAQLADEKARNAFIQMRQGLKEADAFKSSQEPVAAWLQQRAEQQAKALGYETVEPEMVQSIFQQTQADVRLIDAAYSDDPNVRSEGFHQAFYQQDPAAYMRFISDIAADPNVQANSLMSLGVANEEIPDLVKAIQSGAWKNATQAVESSFNEDVMAEVAQYPQLQEVYRSLPGYKQEIANGIYDPNQLANYLYEQQQLQETAKQRQDWDRQQSNAKAQEAQQQLASRKEGAYNTVRDTVKAALSSIFPNNPEAQDFVMSAAEAKLYSSPEGAALWHELEAHLENGQMRDYQLKLPQMMAKAKVIAMEQAKWLNSQAEKARQYDEIMRFGTAEEIQNYLNQQRGKQAVLRPGAPPATNGHQLPNPKARGQYDPANIASYGVSAG